MILKPQVYPPKDNEIRPNIKGIRRVYLRPDKKLAKIETLLKELGIKYRILENPNYPQIDILVEIDYEIKEICQ